MSSRERLQNRRAHEGVEFDHEGMRCRAGLGRFADGRPAEVFLHLSKDNSAADVNARDAAVAASLPLQFGCPLATLRRALMRDGSGRASGVLGAALDRLAPVDPEGGES